MNLLDYGNKAIAIGLVSLTLAIPEKNIASRNLLNTPKVLSI